MSVVAAVEGAERVQLVGDLKAARAELVKRGRSVGRLISNTRQVCARGAVAVAVVDDFEALYLSKKVVAGIEEWARNLNNYRYGRACLQLRNHLPSGYTAVEFFNDARTTTDQDILDLFDKTLADLGGLA